MKNYKRVIEHAKIVSFDIFDTLLVRPYIKPTDVFIHMEKHFNATFFHDCRVNAERAAREKHSNREDITFNDIYDEIDDNFKYLKEQELKWEEMVLQPNPEILDIWNAAKKLGKKIVIASDMYLPTTFIEKVLKKNGFSGYDKLYVSGDLNITKWKGTMFDAIAKDMSVKPHEILHIGDNEHSDYKIPHRKGIKTLHIKALAEKFIKRNPRIQKFFDRQYDKLGASILVSILAIRSAKNKDCDYWHNLGYEYGGPIIYGYTRWIESIAKYENIDHLFFVARDGYTLQKVFNIFNSTIKNSYVYAPRFLNLICRLDYFKYDIAQSSGIIDFFATKDSKIAKMKERTTLNTWQDYHNFIKNNKNTFIKAASKEYKSYQDYLFNQCKSKSEKFALVDTITGRFSSQKIIQSATTKDVLAFYWAVVEHPYEGVYHFKEFVKNNKRLDYVFTKNWNFMEFLMTSPEYPIKTLQDGKPVYDKNPTESEKIRHDIYPYVSDGAVDFANDVKKLFNNADIYLDGPTLVKWVNCLCDIPTKQDIKYLSLIKHAYDAKHSDYIPLFCTKIPLKMALLHPKKSLTIIRQSIWRTWLQSFMLALFKPLKIKMRGIRIIRLLFFPTFKWRYFNLIVRLSRRWYYVISIGKPLEL